MGKASYTLFQKPSTKGGIPLKIPELVINNELLGWKRFIKFLGVVLLMHFMERSHKNSPK